MFCSGKVACSALGLVHALSGIDSISASSRDYDSPEISKKRGLSINLDIHHSKVSSSDSGFKGSFVIGDGPL